MRFPRLLAFIPLLLVLGMLLLPTAALAHERRTIANGKVDAVVGWDQEPSFTNLKNGASIRLSQAGTNPPVPVEGADKTLKIQIKQGAATKEFPLRAVFGQPGYYVADLVPTRAGDYQFIFTGTINGEQVNETFDSADGKFDGVEPLAGVEFPLAAPEPAQTAAAAQAAQSDAQSARTLAYVGIALGALGLIAAGAAFATRSRAGSGAASRPVTERV
jgi:hypothetical protein